ncbi:MAG TPA: ATP-binding protein [Gemmatimonadaceae bacterium]|nr:ATP-binding protein [Gemmatimonadaceae bacterium]
MNELENSDQTVELRLDWAMARAGLGICTISRQGEVLSASDGLARMLGYVAANDVLGLDLGAGIFVDPDDFASIVAGADAPSSEWIETHWKRRDGSLVVMRLVARRVSDDSGRDRLEILADDVTERRRQEELVRRSERMASLGAVLAGAAHELNNPLAAILGFSQLLLRRRWPLEDRTALEAIHHEAMRSATIVKDLLALARRRGVERRAPADVNELVAYIMRTRRYAFETAGILCNLELGHPIPPVRGDRTQLEQVILNLLNNAEQALRPRVDGHRSTSPGRILIRTRHEEPNVIVEVEDNGPGVPDDVHADIWDPFWTSKEEGEGTGLGLTVVHTIVVDHGGSVTLERSSLGGARFVVRLPTVSATEQPAAPSRASRPLDVLVVDPRSADLPFVERFLASRGHAVINAASGEAALRLASQSRFDAVVCDADLAVSGGVPIVNELRASSGCAHARFVLSAERSPPAMDEGIAYVMRPYDVDELRRLIEG